MSKSLSTLFDIILTMSPEELIGAIVCALILSCAMAGLYCWGRRKWTDALTILTVLMLLSNLIAMAAAVAFMVRYDPRLQPEEPGEVAAAVPYPAPGFRAMRIRIFDTDRDGVLSRDEIENATARLRSFDADHDGSVTPQEFRTFLKFQWDVYDETENAVDYPHHGPRDHLSALVHPARRRGPSYRE